MLTSKICLKPVLKLIFLLMKIKLFLNLHPKRLAYNKKRKCIFQFNSFFYFNYLVLVSHYLIAWSMIVIWPFAKTHQLCLILLLIDIFKQIYLRFRSFQSNCCVFLQITYVGKTAGCQFASGKFLSDVPAHSLSFMLSGFTHRSS